MGGKIGVVDGVLRLIICNAELFLLALAK